MKSEITHPPLIIFALEAGDPTEIQQLAAQGYLPNIASMMRKGCWAPIFGDAPSEHGAWVSLFSGVSRAGHGYYYYRQLKSRSYDIQLKTSLDANAQPFWSHLNSAARVATIDVPDIHPVPGIPGTQVANWSVHSTNSPFPTTTEPAELLEQLRKDCGPVPKRINEVIGASSKREVEIYRALLESVETKGTFCRHVLQKNQWELAVIGFTESHTAGHQFWKYKRETASETDEQPVLRNAIRDIYASIDRQIQAILDDCSNDANVVIVCSAGLHDHYPTTGIIEDFCRKLGYQATPEPGPPSLNPMAIARRFLPESLRVALSQFLPRNTRDNILAEQFRNGTDWTKTTAFYLPSVYTGMLRVNLHGREPNGVVKLDEYEGVLQQLENDLLQLIDPVTDAPAVLRVVRSNDGAPLESSMPDLFVEWQPVAHFMTRLVHPKVELVQQKPEFFRDNDHGKHGFFIASGPSIESHGSVADIFLLDLAPTFLSLLHQPLPQQFGGTVIDEIMKRESQPSAQHGI